MIYHDKKDEQEEIIIVKQLLSEDYHLFNKCYACIWGGRHPFQRNLIKMFICQI